MRGNSRTLRGLRRPNWADFPTYGGEYGSYLLALSRFRTLIGLLYLRMSGKGSKRRPTTVTIKEWEKKWELIFNK